MSIIVLKASLSWVSVGRKPQLLSCTHKGQMRSRLHAGQPMLAGDDFLLPAEVVAFVFVSGAKDARCIVRSTVSEHCLYDSLVIMSDHQGGAELRTMYVRRISVLIPIHLFSIVVVRLGLIGIVATVIVVRMIFLALGMGLSCTPLELVQSCQHLVGHDGS